MFPNLRAEMTRKGFSVKELARKIGIGESTLHQKLNGSYSFTLDEALMIRAVLDVDMTIDFLFEKKKSV